MVTPTPYVRAVEANNTMADVIRTDRNAPPGWHTITPRLVAQNARELVEFLAHVFGASGRYESTAPTIVEIGDSKIMVSETTSRAASAALLYVYVSDLELAYRRALEQGASSLEEPFDTPYGDRRCMVEDKWGNIWQIAVRPAK
jgi:PhnB protein